MQLYAKFHMSELYNGLCVQWFWASIVSLFK